MDPMTALLAFSGAAFLMTVTPGLDTALVLRTAAVEGPRPAMMAGLGISLGVLFWGIATALGLSALLAVSETAFRALQIAGAAYLFYLGLKLLRSAWRGGATPFAAEAPAAKARGGREWLARGLTTNLLNPKVGVFYVSFLPQFLPPEVSAGAFGALLAGIHGIMGLLWFAALTLATRPLSRLLRKPEVSRGLDGVLGALMLGFGLRLLLEGRAR